MLCLAISHPVRAIEHISFSADRIDSPTVSVVKPVGKVQLSGSPTFALEADQLGNVAGTITLRVPGLRCSSLDIGALRLSCAAGVLQASQGKLPIALQADLASPGVTITSEPQPGERWEAAVNLSDGWRATANIRNGQIARLATWLPVEWPALTGGSIDGALQAHGKVGQLMAANVDLQIKEAAFSDSAGLHAAEHLALQVKAQLRQATPGGATDFSVQADYLAGDVFWEPVFVSRGGYQLSAAGTYAEGIVKIAQAKARIANIGDAEMTGALTLDPLQVQSAEVRTGTLQMGPLFDVFIKPQFARTALGEASASGTLRAGVTVRDGKVMTAEAALGDVSLTDPRSRFGVSRLSVTLPWERGKPLRTRATIESASLLNIPVGRMSIPIALEDDGINMRHIAIPILDGRLEVSNFDLRRVGEDEQATWTWRLDGRITPISMAALTAALKLPVMKGTLSGEIPNVVYARETLAVNGDIEVNVFDGKLVGKDIALLEPLGRAPRLLGDFSARNLDLDLITSTLSFGRMEGRVDVTVKGLELAAWRPVKFDAVLQSADGDYRRRISQQAVQNISALGGAGAAAAIQRSMLRVFEEFGYEKLGLTCRLENGICTMGGVENAAQGFVLVKGGGIPAITVLGYNRNVSWATLLERLQGIVEGNVKPTIQ